MKKQTLTILALAGTAWWLLKKNRRASGSDVLDNAEEPLIAPSRDRVGMMTDAPVSLENIRKGIARGWYKAQLCTIDGHPAVKLSGTANGKPYSDYYPVSQATWNSLKQDSVQEIGVSGVGKLPYEKNRKEAAHKLWKIAKGYGENVSEATVYRACFYDPRHDTWRYIGRAYDYTIDRSDF